MKIRLYFLSSQTNGWVILLDSNQMPFEKPFPSLSVAPKISNIFVWPNAYICQFLEPLQLRNPKAHLNHD